jgi:predicted nucleic acid-binding protein
LLRELYSEVLVPNAVAEEVTRHLAAELNAGLASGWLKRVTPSDRARVDEIERDLGGRGEAEVIGVGRGLIERVMPLLDDLRRNGFWLDDATYRKAREPASEP